MKIPSNLLPLLDQFSPEIREKIVLGWSAPRSIISFRVNYLKSTKEEVVQELKKAGLPYQEYSFQVHQTPLVYDHPPLSGGQDTTAYYLPNEHEYTLRGLNIYKEGKIYVQSIASMIPVQCLDLKPGQKILDMTAAPGSKTTQIASILRGDCEITALEKFGIRYEKLLHTIRSQGAEGCVKVVKIDASTVASFLKEVPTKEAEDFGINKSPCRSATSPFKKGAQFDRVLIDAPCSSDGRIQLSDERTYRWYSEEKSHSKSLLQYEMLEQARKLLAPGGRIVYSTCSISRRENEEVIQKFLKTHPDFHLLPCPIACDYTLDVNNIENAQKRVGREKGVNLTSSKNFGAEGSLQDSKGPRRKSELTKSDDVFPCFQNMNRWFPSAMMEGFFVAILVRL